jgi:hypothetical protein
VILQLTSLLLANMDVSKLLEAISAILHEVDPPRCRDGGLALQPD